MDSGDSDRWNGCLEATGGVWQQYQNGWWYVGLDGKIYYFKGDGIMAKNVTIRSESKGMTFKLDCEGVCDPEGIKIE